MSDHPVCTKTFKLNNGSPFPAVGLGTSQGGNIKADDEKKVEDAIIFAIQNGYRLIDTAQYYLNEHIVGRAVRNSGVPRSEITVITKFWGDWHHDPARALQISLETLGLDYVDVFLMHWPWATTPAPECKPLRKTESPTIVETWQKMEPLVGPTCRAIGVSNFTQKTLEEILAHARIVPAVNEVELHALNPNLKLVPYCQSKGIQVISWGTMGSIVPGTQTKNLVLTHPLFTDIAKKHNCSAGVVSLSWAVQRGITVIPKSVTHDRIKDNIKLVTLTESEIETINNAHKTIGQHRIADAIEDNVVYMDGVRTLQGWSLVDYGWEDEQGNWLV